MTRNPEVIEPILKDLVLEQNAKTLESEVLWFREVLEVRFALYFENECNYRAIAEIPMPSLVEDSSEYARLVTQYNMNIEERLLLIITIIPYVKPQALNLFFIQDKSINREFVEFGGWRGKVHQGFLPTAETAAFIIAGKNMSMRLRLLTLFDKEHFFIKDGILDIQLSSHDESFYSTRLSLSNEYFHRLTTGVSHKPDYTINFPAQLLTTTLNWTDLVLPSKVLDEVVHINTWIENQIEILHNMGLNKSIKPGYRALFYGPPGTGKTLTASLLGQSSDMDVYRIDLSNVVSKYIGETEKNLESIFRQAEHKQWILFFDEADALFSKRTAASTSNDRFANQEISYLLQRIELFPGVVILATNLKDNIDDAFARRFQSIVYFPMPDEYERLELWQSAFKNCNYLDDDIDLREISRKYELAGGSIVNVIRFAAISSVKSDKRKICQADLITGVIKELRKSGRTI